MGLSRLTEKILSSQARLLEDICAGCVKVSSFPLVSFAALVSLSLSLSHLPSLSFTAISSHSLDMLSVPFSKIIFLVYFLYQDTRGLFRKDLRTSG
jgi:hypothetical protein